MSFRLEDKVCYVEDVVTPILAATLDRLGEHYLTDDTMLHLGTPIKLNPSGSRAVGAIFHIALADPDEGEGEEFNSDDDSVGFIVFGVARTLPELLEACNELLAANPAVRIVLGVKQYEMKTEQLVAIRSCKQGDGTVEKKAVSFGSKALDPSTVLLLERDGAQVSGVGLGGVACDRIGLEDYQMELPPADVVVDLYHLQRLLDGVTNKAPEPVWNDLGYELTLTEEQQRAWCEERERLFAEMRERNKDVEDPCKKKPKSKSTSKSKTKRKRLA
ncbi:hypothetical protein SELMODRAFT_428611 [Selaginella moellendorffii]|uniref:Uncharacterized protein n=1 Tax=Selaginella moellendorffii TaxID=88036 RepID=D8T3E9_SELML|nr:hypothetical protein SELMODRAFT_428611 [Selaginella moellendorffii]